ncbi:MAG: hypothetical protein GTN81_03080 [Proteobacteria bacterium]|nr:hypothetical protein [Pseudomonadota bacterium]
MDRREGTCDLPLIYRPFVASGEPDITLRLHRGIPDFARGERVFDCPPMWTLYRQNGKSIVEIFHDPIFSGLERTLVLPSDDRGDLYFTANPPYDTDPFHGPTIELVMGHYLAHGRGAIIHACGFAMNGKGLLFVGQSGTGKSTLARLWDKEGGGGILSDDRIIVRDRGSQFWMYGTPWHGDAKLASPEEVKLERIFFLRHGHENSVKGIEGIDPVSRLLSCSFPTHWDPQGMRFALELFTNMTARIPCSELTFKPSGSVTRLVEKTIR